MAADYASSGGNSADIEGLRADINNVAAQNTIKHFKVENVSANSANSDVGVFTGLPAKYFIRDCFFYNPSMALSNATFDLMGAPNGGGDHLITRFKVSALADSMQYTPAVLAVSGNQTVRTENTLYLRNVAPEGSPSTLSAMLEIQVI